MVLENESRILEGDPMVLQIQRRFIGIPFKLHESL